MGYAPASRHVGPVAVALGDVLGSRQDLQISLYKDGTWRAYLTVGGKAHFKYGFKTEEEAYAAFLELKAALHQFNPSVPDRSGTSRRIPAAL